MRKQPKTKASTKITCALSPTGYMNVPITSNKGTGGYFSPQIPLAGQGWHGTCHTLSVAHASEQEPRSDKWGVFLIPHEWGDWDCICLTMHPCKEGTGTGYSNTYRAHHARHAWGHGAGHHLTRTCLPQEHYGIHEGGAREAGKVFASP